MPTGSASAAASFGHAINHVVNGSLRRMYRGIQYSTYQTSFAPAFTQPFSSYTFQVVGAASIDVSAAVPGDTITIKGTVFTNAASLVAATDWNDKLTLAAAIRAKFVGELTAGVVSAPIVMVSTIPGNWTDATLSLYTLASTMVSSWQDYTNASPLIVAGQLNVVPIMDMEVPINLTVGGARAEESLLANWYVFGAKAFLTLHPRDGFTGEKVGSFTGPDPVRVTFQETGQLTFEQPIENYYHLLDRPLTLFCYLAQDTRNVSVLLEIDYGGGKVSSLTVPSSAYRSGGQLRINTLVPYDATQFVVRLVLNGSESSSFYLGEVGLYIGHYSSVRYTEDIVGHARPVGECLFFYGYPAPPGFITVCDSDGKLVFHSAGDPQVDGEDETPFGGEDSHNHNQRTEISDSGDNPKGGGRWVLGKNHFHVVGDATMVPLNFKVLMVERV